MEMTESGCHIVDLDLPVGWVPWVMQRNIPAVLLLGRMEGLGTMYFDNRNVALK